MLFLAETLWSSCRLPESLHFYEQCIQQDPNDKFLYKKKAHIFDLLKRYEEALNEINKALALYSNDSESLNLKGTLIL